MKIFGLNISRSSRDIVPVAQAVVERIEAKSDGIDIDTLMARLHAVHDTVSRIFVNEETCMEAPTVQAIVQAVSRRVATLPVQVLLKTRKKGRVFKEEQPDHPVQRLLNQPNLYQSTVSYWLDATSRLVRYNRYFAFKARGKTGPIRRLMPMHPRSTDVDLNDDGMLVYKYTDEKGRHFEYEYYDVHYVRGPARDGYCGDSPVNDVRESIALEIAAEKFGASFFGNGALPFLVFKFMQGIKGFRTVEEEKKFVEDIQQAYSGRNRFRSLTLPAGMDVADPIRVENNRAQFLETRKYQRTVIAGAWGVPPHMIGDLTGGTFNNVEQQSIDFVQNVVHPYIRMCESQMEMDLLTTSDRNNGIIIRFNIEAALRGDFSSRQEGLATQRRNGIINANEWRERENMNPIDEDDGGEDYWVESGVTVVGAEPLVDPASEPATPTSTPVEPAQSEDT